MPDEKVITPEQARALVKRLRDEPFSGLRPAVGLFYESADAVESLAGQVEQLKARLGLVLKKQGIEDQGAAAKRGELVYPRWLDEWHEDHGPVLWWDALSITEPPAYCGTPLDSDWPWRGMSALLIWAPMPQLASDSPISSPTGDAGASSGAELSRCGAELPLLGSNQDSSDPESPVNHRGSTPPAPGNPAGDPVEPSGSSPLRHPPARASFARPMGVTMGVDRHLGRVWVVG